jgi:hypothetical protein
MTCDISISTDASQGARSRRSWTSPGANWLSSADLGIPLR